MFFFIFVSLGDWAVAVEHSIVPGWPVVRLDFGHRCRFRCHCWALVVLVAAVGHPCRPMAAVVNAPSAEWPVRRAMQPFGSGWTCSLWWARHPGHRRSQAVEELVAAHSALGCTENGFDEMRRKITCERIRHIFSELEEILAIFFSFHSKSLLLTTSSSISS